MGDRRTHLDEERRDLHWRRLRSIAAEESRALAFVTVVVALLVLFRGVATMGFVGIGEPRPPPLERLDNLWPDFLTHLAFALPMMAIIQPVRRLGPPDGWRRWLVVAAATLLAAALAATARSVWYYYYQGQPDDQMFHWRTWWLMTSRFAVPGAMMVAVGEFHRSQFRSLESMRAAEAEREALERASLQARLRTLEAQIEPHFLFNTLANVRRLYETDAAAGERMLDRLTAYLRFALPTMRDERPTLQREGQLIEAYLDLQRVRMGRRLDYSIDIPPALGAVEVPSMMLLTLVENSIKHGLAPLREGGRIEVGAHVDGGELRLEVADTGRGFGGDSAGGGTGLANIRARLAAMFGARAGLSLQAREPHGLVARISLPVPA